MLLVFQDEDVADRPTEDWIRGGQQKNRGQPRMDQDGGGSTTKLDSLSPKYHFDFHFYFSISLMWVGPTYCNFTDVPSMTSVVHVRGWAQRRYPLCQHNRPELRHRRRDRGILVVSTGYERETEEWNRGSGCLGGVYRWQERGADKQQRWVHMMHICYNNVSCTLVEKIFHLNNSILFHKYLFCNLQKFSGGVTRTCAYWQFWITLFCLWKLWCDL